MRMSRRMGLLGGKKLVLPTLAELFADMTAVAQEGINMSSSDIVTVSELYIEMYPSIYVFAFNRNSFAIHHLLSDGSEYIKTTLYRATDDSNATDIHKSGWGIQSGSEYHKYSLSTDGSSNAKVHGGTIIAATFPSYTDDQISAVFGNISVKNSAGRDNSSPGTIYLSNTVITGEIILTAYRGAMCAAPVTSPTEYICTLDYKNSVSVTLKVRNYVTSGETYLSAKGTSSTRVYGGTILII